MHLVHLVKTIERLAKDKQETIERLAKDNIYEDIT